MAIGDLYDANNVKVGQAAVLFAPEGTALPDFSGLNLADPFDPTPFVSYTLTVAATTSFTLSYGGTATTALSDTSTAAEITTALEALPAVGAGNVTVTGATSPFTIAFTESAAGGTLTADATSGTATLTGGLWVPVGATDQGWTYGTNKSTQVIGIEEQSTQVATTINTQAVSIAGALSEDISRTLALAYNAVLSATAPTTTDPGFDDIALSDDVLYYAVAMLAQTFDNLPRIIYAPKWSQLANTTTAFRRASAKRMYPVDFQTACKPSQIHVFNITAAKTG